ncbi:hypothetical protein GORBP_036_00180 [Gordonia rubripertincta NBRC 101908]|uniref:Uncharacterized protein n=1 Tax=Gordonia rubripertincta NBRC 101908 TaxID=1077975 RepID=A0ABQ0HPR7_GORRU|nr:hypothetical protein GORBP_036_00180 [Gordonia rubripertincta NBRC 101908]
MHNDRIIDLADSLLRNQGIRAHANTEVGSVSDASNIGRPADAARRAIANPTVARGAVSNEKNMIQTTAPKSYSLGT